MAVLVVYVPAQVMSTSPAALAKPEGIVHKVREFHRNEHPAASVKEAETMNDVPWEVRGKARWCRTVCGKNIGYTHHSGQQRRRCKHCFNRSAWPNDPTSLFMSGWIAQPMWRSILGGQLIGGDTSDAPTVPAETAPPTEPR